jgi:formate dehydrogenase iron-sulfur subunit
VPHIFENHVSKCIACLELVKDGGTPWCATTCPSQAIKFGERGKILADAQARVAQIKPRYPTAHVYGETQLGGLGLLMVLLDKPSIYGLPDDPQMPVTLTAWKKVVQPASVGLTVTAIVATGLSFIIARRQHLREKAELHTEETHPSTSLRSAQDGEAGEKKDNG